MLYERIRDRRELHRRLLDAGHTPPHPEEDEENFNQYINTVVAQESIYPSFSECFHSDPTPFDPGGGMSGGGGADGNW